jgi:hypothetical protein
MIDSISKFIGWGVGLFVYAMLVVWLYPNQPTLVYVFLGCSYTVFYIIIAQFRKQKGQ